MCKKIWQKNLIAFLDDIYVTLVLQFIPGLCSVGVMVNLNRIPTSVYGYFSLFWKFLLVHNFDISLNLEFLRR